MRPLGPFWCAGSCARIGDMYLVKVWYVRISTVIVEHLGDTAPLVEQMQLVLLIKITKSKWPAHTSIPLLKPVATASETQHQADNETSWYLRTLVFVTLSCCCALTSVQMDTIDESEEGNSSNLWLWGRSHDGQAGEPPFCASMRSAALCGVCVFACFSEVESSVPDRPPPGDVRRRNMLSPCAHTNPRPRWGADRISVLWLKAHSRA
jgi:hypothetical protein